VIAVRNGAATLQRCLDSIFEQTYHGVEVIIMDGASTDGTQGVIEANADRIAYWESEPDRGVYHAWNKALGHVSGEWITFLGADDRYATRDALGRMAQTLAATAGRHRIVYGTLRVVDQGGAEVRTSGEPWERAVRGFRHGMRIPHPATFYRRSYFDDNGRFDETFVIAGDYEMLLRDVLRREPLFLPGPVVVEMTSGGISDRPENFVTRAREDYRARKMHGLTRLPEWLSPALVRARIYGLIGRTFGAGAAVAFVRAYRLVFKRGRR
jgi:glycosyltransferase involved in cell wall biosynthesis